MPALRYTTCQFNAADVRNSAGVSSCLLLNGIAAVTCPPAQAPGNSRLLLLQHGAASASWLELPSTIYPELLCHAVVCGFWSWTENARAKSSSTPPPSAGPRYYSTCFQGRHTNQGLL